ncbi:hypothetical protein ELI03_02330 [Rhizobium leguminosarum]|uniref:Uncharacterized protein n=1 Tax=Rhizobium leguminosarum TaxID=384 RepID=A0A4Q8XVN2_RHILE|nr:hypothetical protein ELI03_02330 [Rhizobium leguminosarum]
MQFRTEKRLQRRASFQTRKGRCNTFNPRIELSENRFRFSGRCASVFPAMLLAHGTHDEPGGHAGLFAISFLS